MKYLLTTITGMVLLSLTAVTGFAQQNKLSTKPALFNSLPGTINCTAAELSRFFVVPEGQNTKLSFDNALKSNAFVARNIVKYKNLQSLAIKLPEFNNAIFALSKRTDEKNNIVYTGRILSQSNSDAYQLKKIDNNKYQLIKINLETILTDCAQQ